MLKILPTININFKSPAKTNANRDSSSDGHNNDDKKLCATLLGLAAAGAAIVGLKHTSKMSYEEALKKAGVQIKDNVAILIDSGEKFTGKIQRFEKRNRKETVEFENGIIKERVYHNLFGKELNGKFYKDGVIVVWVSKRCGKFYAIRTYENGKLASQGDGSLPKEKSLFEEMRAYVKELKK